MVVFGLPIDARLIVDAVILLVDLIDMRLMCSILALSNVQILMHFKYGQPFPKQCQTILMKMWYYMIE